MTKVTYKKGSVQLGLQFQRVKSHRGRAKALWQELLRAHVSSLEHKIGSTNSKWYESFEASKLPQWHSSLNKATPSNPSQTAPPTVDSIQNRSLYSSRLLCECYCYPFSTDSVHFSCSVVLHIVGLLSLHITFRICLLGLRRWLSG